MSILNSHCSLAQYLVVARDNHGFDFGLVVGERVNRAKRDFRFRGERRASQSGYQYFDFAGHDGRADGKFPHVFEEFRGNRSADLFSKEQVLENFKQENAANAGNSRSAQGAGEKSFHRHFYYQGKRHRAL